MLRKLVLENFKTFKHATIPLGPVSIVLGANGSGKSNLFDAMSFLRAIGEGRSVRDSIEGHALPGGAITAVSGIRGGAGSVTHFGSDSSEFSIQANLRIDREHYTYYVKVDVERYRVVQEELSSTGHPGPYVYSTRPDTGPLDQNIDSPVIQARFYKNQRGINPKRDFSPYEFILSQFFSRRAESRQNEVPAEEVREEFASIRPLELRPETLRQYSTMGRTELGEHGENFAGAVQSLLDEAGTPIVSLAKDDAGVGHVNRGAVSRRDGVVAWLNELTPRPVEEISTERAPTGEVVFAVRERPTRRLVAAPSLSDGTLRFAALALATVGTSGRRTLLIEELENGINPSRLSLLVKMLEQAAEVEENDVQIIASTHSPSVLDYASESTIKDSVVIGWDHEGQCSKPTRLTDLPELDQILQERPIGELQAEGWLQFAADS